ncbi:MAG: hypothetical protein FWC44_01140 [Methanomassiliicoccaceae archaeon]|nr:hypothetical protein [Methanomassiliicoccaceae archaeon]
MSTTTVEVLGVSRATDGATGEELITVQFGKLNKEAKRPQNVPPGIVYRQPASLVLTLFFKFREAAPYKVGSKWSLNVSDDGAIQLIEEKK